MARATIIAECATAHGGDLAVAEDMIRAAADAGADLVKFQTYTLARLNPSDPQADWLRQAHLDRAAHERLIRACEAAGVQFLSTPFDREALQMLRELGRTRFKIASSESGRWWWQPGPGEMWYVSWPWGRQGPGADLPSVDLPADPSRILTHLTAIPLYPTPLECVGQVAILDGWSDHTIGLDACLWALANEAQVIEAHLTLPGRSREKPWDKTPEQFRRLREFAESVATMHTGVSETFRTRWTA